MVFILVIKHSFCFEAKFFALSFQLTSLRYFCPGSSALWGPNILKSHGAVSRYMELHDRTLTYSG
jgi:hypothetical protein